MIFRIIEQSKNSSLRTGEIEIVYGKIQTPVFMPVGTVGAVKTVAPWELRELGAEIILGNTYHLYLRPGEKLIEKFDGLAAFNHWKGPTLTDSGGYQVFSLGAKKNQRSKIKDQNDKSNIKNNCRKSLVEITDDGVEFSSHLDGSKHFFSPEKVIDIQLAIGADIIMPLDVCPPSKASQEEIERAVKLSIEWLKRSKKHLEQKRLKNKPALFGIIQGGIYPDLRQLCAEEMIELDLPGYAIGGLAVGESQKEMLEIVKLLNGILPKDKPRYLMGVGTLDDIEKTTKLGVDMFDCVLPTRMARHGVAYAKIKNQRSKIKIKEDNSFEEINLARSKYKTDKNPIDENCRCPACREKFSRAYLHHLVKEKEILGIRLLTLHNLWTYLDFMRQIRKSI